MKFLKDPAKRKTLDKWMNVAMLFTLVHTLFFSSMPMPLRAAMIVYSTFILTLELSKAVSNNQTASEAITALPEPQAKKTDMTLFFTELSQANAKTKNKE